jgi:hypothetical protein
MNPKLEARRANSELKCANCGWWRGGARSAGECGRHDFFIPGQGSTAKLITLDLAVCTDWRDGDPVQEVLPPETQE